MLDAYQFGDFSPYAPNLTSLISYGVLVLVIIGILLIIISALGERKEEKQKLLPYECGLNASTLPVGPQHIPFYLVAIFFVIFDIETAFIFSWAVAFKSLGLTGWLRITFFIFVLLLGLFYLWKKGGLNWRTMPNGTWKTSPIRSSEK